MEDPTTLHGRVAALSHIQLVVLMYMITHNHPEIVERELDDLEEWEQRRGYQAGEDPAGPAGNSTRRPGADS